ncbi:ribonuclease III [Aestuariibacter sp. AA17]|uniref:Ribonuclease 3 n=1 Tax=Fluctibacter corallii TaxID=2984329 RepID=A0ABT3A3J5_9ALTE|nr:ribonuclease III [Aestuariibacter sp. AA17]MCV2883244.1 ribonuclease III [Aestuariibacter sp. AA17]
MNESLKYVQLYKKLGYTFDNAANLKLALTHRSASKKHNERLEYLGDAVLGMVIAKQLFTQFPKQPEGSLTRMRASLVKGETLAELGKDFELGELLELGPGELKSGGHRRSSILADAVEAIIGAIYLESDFVTCETLILKWFDSRLKSLNPDVHLKDDKTRLQEYLQGKKLPLPEYDIVNITGKDHDQTFEVSCRVTVFDNPAIGRGNSRRKAEQQAARKVLEKLNSD